mgnify:CR=1 FL=1
MSCVQLQQETGQEPYSVISMKGQVQIYVNYGTSKEKKIFEGKNTILPTFGRAIARAMMVPSSTGSTAGSSVSSTASAVSTSSVGVYNCSSYGPQAMSFGKDVSAYEGSCGFGASAPKDVSEPTIFNSHHLVSFSGDPSSTFLASAIFGVSSTHLYSPKAIRSDYRPNLNLNKLEPCSITPVLRHSILDPVNGPSAILMTAVSGDTGWTKTAATTMSSSLVISGMQEAISELVRRDPGHNLNIAAKPWYLLSYVSGIDQRKGDAVYAQASGFYNSLSVQSKTAIKRFANLLGCYAASSNSTIDTSAVVVSSFPTVASTWNGTIANIGSGKHPTGAGSGLIAGPASAFNTTMDPFGYAQLTINNATTASSDLYVEYKCVINGKDKALSNFYGGIYNVGLWSIDVDKTVLENPNSQIPLKFHELYNPLRYNLLAQRRINSIIGYEDAYDMVSMNDFTVIWRISFV